MMEGACEKRLNQKTGEGENEFGDGRGHGLWGQPPRELIDELLRELEIS
jgi:hypothetical protein